MGAWGHGGMGAGDPPSLKPSLKHRFSKEATVDEEGRVGVCVKSSKFNV